MTSLRLFTEKVFPRSRRARLIIQKTQRSEIRKTTYENIECCSICDESRFILRNSVFSLDKSTWNSWNFLTSLRFFVNLMPENSARHVKNQTLVRTGIQQKNHSQWRSLHSHPSSAVLKTYAATLEISCSERRPLKAGIAFFP